MKPDLYQVSIMLTTAAQFQKLSALRGIVGASITVDTHKGTYIANGIDCGPSVHGLYDWLDAQPGVKP